MDGLSLLLLFLTGGVGVCLRYGIDLLFPQTTLPYATFGINVLGSLAIGMVFSLTQKGVLSPEIRLVLSTGFLGGFTTFSAYSLQVVGLLTEGRLKEGLIYFTLSPLLCVVAAFLGTLFTR